MNLIVSDFDGTFFDENYNKNIELINKNKDNFDFVIATGRSIFSLEKDLKVNCKYYICNDGGYILDSNKNIIYKKYIDFGTVNEMHKRIKDLGCTEFYFDNINEISTVPIEPVNKILVKLNHDGNDEKNMNNILNGIKKAYGYISDNWINIMSIESAKENGVDFISKLENYDNIYVVGNDINDYKMLKKYNGYLVSNKNIYGFNIINSFQDLKDKIKMIN